MGVERSTLFFDIFARLRGGGLKELERDAERAEDALEDLDGANKRLADSTPESVRQLRAQKEATDDVADSSYKAKHALENLRKGRHRLEDILPTGGGGKKPEQQGHGVGVRIGAAMARGIARALDDGSRMIGKSLTALPPQAQAGLIAGLAALAVPLGAALNGLILAALGTGVVAAGVAVAVQDPRVKEAGSSLGKELLAGLQSSAKAFVPATLGAIADIRDQFRGMSGELGRMFDAAAMHVRPLTSALTGFVRELLPGLTTTMRNIGPVMDAFSDGLQGLGRTLGDSFALMSTQSEGAAQGLRDLFLVLRVGVASVSLAVAELSALRMVIGYVNDAALGPAAAFLGVTSAGDGTVRMLHRAAPAFEETAAASRALAAQMLYLAEAQRQAEEAARGAFDAETDLGEAILKSTNEVYKNNAGISTKTKQGILNRKMLHDLAVASTKAAERTMAHTRGIGQFITHSLRANKQLGIGYEAFMKAAEGMNVSRTAAHRLAIQLGLIPPARSTKVSVATAAAMSALRNFSHKADAAARSRTVFFNVRVGNLGAVGAALARAGHRALGGPVQAGRPYIVGERGPEVIVPDRNGTVVPNNQINKRSAMASHPAIGGGAAGTVRVTYDTVGAYDDLLRLLRKMVRVEGGGSVQTAFGG